MNKQRVMQAVRDQLSEQLKRLKAANRGASEGATNSESRAETKWDTSGLEASYLARGYARQFEQTVIQLETLRTFKMRDSSTGRVELGSLIQTETGDFQDWLFFLPCCGGMEVDVEGSEVTVLTPESPLAIQLLDKADGAVYHTPGGLQGRIITIV